MSINSEQLLEILARLDQLIELAKAAAERPNLQIVNNSDDSGLAGQICPDLSRDSLTCSGL